MRIEDSKSDKGPQLTRLLPLPSEAAPGPPLPGAAATGGFFQGRVGQFVAGRQVPRGAEVAAPEAVGFPVGLDGVVVGVSLGDPNLGRHDAGLLRKLESR